MERLVEKISEKIYKDIFLYNKDLFIHKDLDLINFKDLITYEFLQPHGNTYPWEFMLYTYNFWKELDYEDWLDILENLKNYNLGLYCYLPFFYKYINIDLLGNYFGMKNISNNSKDYVIDMIDKQKSIFSLDKIDQVILENSGLTQNGLSKITDKLLIQGATKAEHPIKLSNYTIV